MSEWFPTLEALSKKLIWFEASGHYIYEEEPREDSSCINARCLSDCRRGPGEQLFFADLGVV
jgi:hypothetical protein